MSEGAPGTPEKSLVDFTKKPERLEAYKVGDLITRENFIKFLIFTFAVSRGNETAQSIFLEWLQFKYGFPYKKIIDDFYKSVSKFGKQWQELLSDMEQEEFKKAIQGVKIPKHEFEKSGDDFEFRFSNTLASFRNGIPPRDLAFFDIEKIKTIAEFTKRVAEYKEALKKLGEGHFRFGWDS